MYPPLGEARLYKVVRLVGKLPPATHRRNVGLWLDGVHRCNLALATVKGAKESWAVATDEAPTLQTLWQYALRFRERRIINGIESLELLRSEDSRLRSVAALERLYLVADIAILYANTNQYKNCYDVAQFALFLSPDRYIFVSPFA